MVTRPKILSVVCGMLNLPSAEKPRAYCERIVRRADIMLPKKPKLKPSIYGGDAAHDMWVHTGDFPIVTHPTRAHDRPITSGGEARHDASVARRRIDDALIHQQLTRKFGSWGAEPTTVMLKPSDARAMQGVLPGPPIGSSYRNDTTPVNKRPEGRGMHSSFRELLQSDPQLRKLSLEPRVSVTRQAYVDARNARDVKSMQHLMGNHLAAKIFT